MPMTTEGRLGLLEQKGAVMAQQISDINRVLDRVVPYGESLVEVRGMLNALKNDVEYVRSETAEIKELEADNKKAIAANEEKRGRDEKKRVEALEAKQALDESNRRTDRKWWVGQVVVIVLAVIAGVSGIIAAGVHP